MDVVDVVDVVEVVDSLWLESSATVLDGGAWVSLQKVSGGRARSGYEKYSLLIWHTKAWIDEFFEFYIWHQS